MAFQMPEYHQPDFSKEQFIKAPDAKWEIVEIVKPLFIRCHRWILNDTVNKEITGDSYCITQRSCL